MAVNNIKELFIKSTVTRNANRDIAFNKYKDYYDRMHCCVCKRELCNLDLQEVVEHDLCFQCYNPVCSSEENSCCVVIESNSYDKTDRYYLCNNCHSNKCELCDKPELDDSYLECMCGKIVCRECVSIENGNDIKCINCVPKCHSCGLVNYAKIVKCDNCQLWTCDDCIDDKNLICDVCLYSDV